MMVEWCWGSALLYDPRRWPTADGFIPYRVALAAVAALPALGRAPRAGR